MSVTTMSGSRNSVGLRIGGDLRGVSLTSVKEKSVKPLTPQATAVTLMKNVHIADNSNPVVSSDPAAGKPPIPSIIVTPGGEGQDGTNKQPQEATTVVPSTHHSRAYGKICLTMDNVNLSQDKLSETPSMQDGMDKEFEWELRVMSCELMSSAGILLKLPQTAMATSQILFHRFYYTKSFLRQDMEHTAMACIYLASKIEEAPRRIRDVINVFHHLQQLRSGKSIEPMVLDTLYIQLKSDVTLAERRVLKELGFCVHVKHPHKLIVVYLQQLGYDRESQFVQTSWNYMSDSLRTDVFVRYKPETIACACIFLSARKLKIPLPSSPAWYVIFDVSEDQIMDICQTILELYQYPRVDYESLMKKYKGLKKAFKETKDKARAALLDKCAPGSVEAVPSPGSAPSTPRTTVATTAPSHFPPPKDVSDKKREDTWRKSPDPKKRRKSPSPIIYDDGLQRHKKKKRRKSRSHSSSRSHSRERRSSKKHIITKEKSRSRSRSYSPKRSHHKKASKTHHKERYRSRSRSYSPMERDDDRYEKYYKKPKSSKHRDRDEDFNKSRNRDKSRR